MAYRTLYERSCKPVNYRSGGVVPLRVPDQYTLDQLDMEIAERNLYEYVRQAWHVIEPAGTYVDGWHIKAICDHLQAVTDGRIRDFLINEPPRHMKSTIVSVMWPTWTWISRPEKRFLFTSYSDDLSIRDSVKCRNIIQSPWYQERWGDRYQLVGDQNAKERFNNNRTGYRVASSVRGVGTGEGGDFIVADDPNHVKQAESDPVRESVNEWWNVVMTSRRNDPKRSARVIIQQRCHMRDLSGVCLDQGYEALILPARFEADRPCRTSIGWADPRTEDGQLLWPERFGEAELKAWERDMGSYAAAGQLQQRPSPREGGMFPRSHWRFYDRLPDRFDLVIQSWDMAFKDLKDSDYVVGGVWGQVGADKYLLDLVRERMTFSRTCEAVVNLSNKWPAAKAKLVEDKANGTAVIDTLRRRISGLIAVEPQGGKVARASAIQPVIESGNVYLPTPSRAPWVNAYVEEHAQFPTGLHDDQVDMTSQALLYLEKRGAMLKFAPIGNLTQVNPWRV